ncbi:mucin-binding protein, partial [Clostridium perfringens]|uniref:mucin-binding protein n=1 Tax=Clostridium perfringens TaxID=1502 RepID=UPI001ABB700F
MKKKKLKVLVASALLSCCISSFIATPYNVEAKELKTSINQSINNQKQELKGKLHHEIQDSLIKAKKNSSKTQVKYQIKYIDDTTGKEIDTITKIDFANETVTETARDFKGYRLVSEKNQSKTLSEDNNDPIIFHYIKSPKTQVKYQIKYIDDTTGKEIDTITKIDFANETVTETARDFEGYRLVSEKNQSKTLSEDNNDPIIFHYIKSPKTQVKYQIKYIDDTTGKEIDTITKIDFANETVTETARDFEGYRLVSEKNQSKTLSEDNNDPIIFHYAKTQVKYQIKYIDDATGKELYNTITKI